MTNFLLSVTEKFNCKRYSTQIDHFLYSESPERVIQFSFKCANDSNLNNSRARLIRDTTVGSFPSLEILTCVQSKCTKFWSKLLYTWITFSQKYIRKKIIFLFLFRHNHFFSIESSFCPTKKPVWTALESIFFTFLIFFSIKKPTDNV